MSLIQCTHHPNGWTDRQIFAESAVRCMLHACLFWHRQIYWSVRFLLLTCGYEVWSKDRDHRHKLLSSLWKVVGLILRNRMRSLDIQDAFRVGLLLLHVERSQLRLRFGHQDASRMFRERGFLAWKEYLEARPRQAVSHVGQEHLYFLLEELEGPSLLVWVYCVVCYMNAHTVSSLSPSPKLLLLNCHFSVNIDSSNMHYRVPMAISAHYL